MAKLNKAARGKHRWIGFEISMTEISRSKCENIFSKTHFSACKNKAIADAIDAAKRPQIILTGTEAHISILQTAADLLVGEHDFSCFRGSLCQAKSPIKTIEYIQIESSIDELIISIKANAFLHHMVRNIVGTVLKIGRGEKDAEWILSVLDSKDRRKAGPTSAVSYTHLTLPTKA